MTSSMFDPEVLEELRRQFNEADKDGSGELDAGEACRHFARQLSPDGSNETEIAKLAENLRQQTDTDRSGKISFDEYCFRFGRRYQIEANKKRRAQMNGGGAGGGPASPSTARGEGNDAAAELRSEREALEREKEALRREREELERQRAGAAGASGEGASGASAGGEPTSTSGFAAGSRVTIAGLRGAPELNGRTARVCRFDPTTGRYVVELDGAGGQKSIRMDNLTACSVGSASAGLQSLKANLRGACLRLQLWASSYEWWQLLLGAGLVVFFAMAWVQVSNRYPGDKGRSSQSAGGRQSFSSRESTSRYDSDDRQRRPSHGQGHRGDEAFYANDFGNDFDYDPGYSSSYDSGYGFGYGGGGGLLGSLGPNGGMLILVVLAYLCWKGIIPVQNMSMFQLYMLWNMISPLLLGGSGRSFGGPGLYRRRRYF
mmetsp:Transcript_43645/g.120798  ORF Transcript_43645/g.120798 Transcript_43645/m.120798 type:complete len:431 (+) Transcript_43645:61-1353(+)